MDEIQRKLKDVRHEIYEFADRYCPRLETRIIAKGLGHRLGNIWFLISEERRANNRERTIEPHKSQQDRNLDDMEHGGRVEREIYNWQQYGELGARDFISTLRNCGIKPSDLESLAKLMRETS